MNGLIAGVSWIGVFVGFILSFMLGWLWYSPKVFGQTWAEGVGVSLAEGSKMPVSAMMFQALATFGLAWIFGIMLANDALFTIILTLTTLILFIVSSGKYAQKSNVAITIEATYLLAMGIVMLVCQRLF